MTRTRQWALGTAVLCVAIAALGWVLLVSPARSQASSLNAHAASIQASNVGLVGQLAQLHAQSQQLDVQQASLAKFKQRIPSAPELPAYIRGLSAIAATSGVALNAFGPTPPQSVLPSGKLGALTPTATAAGTTTAVPPGLKAITATMSVVGTYPQLTYFLNLMEHQKRVSVVSAIGLAPEAASATLAVGSSPKLSMQLSLTTYYTTS